MSTPLAGGTRQARNQSFISTLKVTFAGPVGKMRQKKLDIVNVTVGSRHTLWDSVYMVTSV